MRGLFMRSISGLALSILLFGATAETSLAQSKSSARGLYVEGAGGLNMLGNSAGFYTLRPDHPTLPNLELPSSTTYEDGWGIAGRFGYAWRSGFRADLELAYRRNGVGHSDFTATNGVAFFPATDTGPRGYAQSLALMANGYYDFLNASVVTPYVGMGIGAVNVGGKYKSSFEPITQHANTISDSDWGVGLQAIAGVSIALAPRISLVADYRFLRAYDISTSEKQFPPITGNEIYAANTVGGRGDYDNHTIMVGLRYTFGP